LQWQQVSKLSRAASILPINANLQLALAITRNTEIARSTFSQLHLTKNGTGRLFMMNDGLQTSAAKGTSESK
jgi:hypothetical protein